MLTRGVHKVTKRSKIQKTQPTWEEKKFCHKMMKKHNIRSQVQAFRMTKRETKGPAAAYWFQVPADFWPSSGSSLENIYYNITVTAYIKATLKQMRVAMVLWCLLLHILTPVMRLSLNLSSQWQMHKNKSVECSRLENQSNPIFILLFSLTWLFRGCCLDSQSWSKLLIQNFFASYCLNYSSEKSVGMAVHR